MKDAVVEFATALTNIVFPVPEDELSVLRLQLYTYLVDHTIKHPLVDRYRSFCKDPSKRQRTIANKGYN